MDGGSAFRGAISACGKLNLGLRVLGRRDDGYHDLWSLMAPLRLCDRVTLTLSPLHSNDKVTGAAWQQPWSLATNEPTLPCDRDNLAWRAAEVFFLHYKLDPTAHRLVIYIEKKIPIGAGLGGGSADAAAVWHLLERAFAGRLAGAPPTPLDMARAVGADVPFCYASTPAVVTGLGEHLDPVPSLPSLPVVLVKPPFSVSTNEAFASLNTRTEVESASERERLDASLKAVRVTGGAAPLASRVDNDFLPGLLRRSFEAREVWETLNRAGFPVVGLTGSGPTFYALADADTSITQLEQTVRALRQQLPQSAVLLTALR